MIRRNEGRKPEDLARAVALEFKTERQSPDRRVVPLKNAVAPRECFQTSDKIVCDGRPVPVARRRRDSMRRYGMLIESV